MFQETDQLLADLADVDLKQCGQQTETLGGSIDADKLKTLEKHRRHNLLRRWIYLSEGYQVSNTVLDTFNTDVLGASFEAAPVLHVGGHTLYRFRSRIFLVPKLPLPHALDNFLPVDWDSTKPLDLPNVWRLEQLGGKADVYHVDRRRGGERLQPNGRAHSQRLKKVMLEASVLPWLRDLLPIVYSNQAIVAVGDQIICGEKRFRLHWLIEQPKRFR